MSTENGHLYEGELKYGKFDGQGVLTMRDGRIYRGHFRENSIEGKGKMEYPSGKLCEGVYEKSLINMDRPRPRHRGIARLPCGAVQKCVFFKDGIPHGEGFLEKADGTLEKGNFNFGDFTCAQVLRSKEPVTANLRTGRFSRSWI